MTESEVWKDVAGYEGFYQVSNKGNVRTYRGYKWYYEVEEENVSK